MIIREAGRDPGVSHARPVAHAERRDIRHRAQLRPAWQLLPGVRCARPVESGIWHRFTVSATAARPSIQVAEEGTRDRTQTSLPFPGAL
jgi:hypothetical protein